MSENNGPFAICEGPWGGYCCLAYETLDDARQNALWEKLPAIFQLASHNPDVLGEMVEIMDVDD